MSLAKLGVGAEGYYLDTVALGTEEYYLGGGEAAGRWRGAGCPALALDGEVGADDLRSVLSGFDPQTGERTVPRNRRVPGFDLTFSAPKSVSLLHGLGSADVSAAVVAAHEAAVDAALAYLEREACRLRRGHDGVHVVEGTGFVAAGFRAPRVAASRVGAAGFRGPDVGVPEISQLVQLLTMRVEVPRQGHGQSGSDRQRHASTLRERECAVHLQ